MEEMKSGMIKKLHFMLMLSKTNKRESDSIKKSLKRSQEMNREIRICFRKKKHKKRDKKKMEKSTKENKLCLETFVLQPENI